MPVNYRGVGEEGHVSKSSVRAVKRRRITLFFIIPKVTILNYLKLN